MAEMWCRQKRLIAQMYWLAVGRVAELVPSWKHPESIEWDEREGKAETNGSAAESGVEDV